MAIYNDTTERVGPHYYRDFITIDGHDIHWTPEGVAFYQQHYTKMLQYHKPGTAYYDHIQNLLQRLAETEQLYRLQHKIKLNFLTL